LVCVVLVVIKNNNKRTLVGKQYAEFRQTGKVRATLSEDDKLIRRLHAEEVLKINLSSLDCQWPRETGTAHGQGAESRVTRKVKPAKTKTAKPTAEKPPLDLKVEAPQIRIVKPASTRTPVEAVESATPPTMKAQTAVEAAPAAAPIRIRLTRDASVVDAPSIGPKTAGRLSVIGVKTVGDLLALTPDEAAQRIKASHINARIIRDWQAQALLACTVPDLPGTAAQLLVGAGVTSLEDLADAEPDFLLDAIALFAASSDGERALRGQSAPDHDRVAYWIASAREVRSGRDAA
jgi:predicted flap endonuclease-1-like 5' DNA nuclease